MDRATLGRLLLALVGVANLVVGFMLWHIFLGFIFLGASLVLTAYAWQYLTAVRLSDEVS